MLEGRHYSLDAHTAQPINGIRYTTIAQERPFVRPVVERLMQFSIDRELNPQEEQQLFAFSSFLLHPRSPENFLAQFYGVDPATVRRKIFDLYDNAQFLSLFEEFNRVWCLDEEGQTQVQDPHSQINKRLEIALSRLQDDINLTERDLVSLAQAGLPFAEIAARYNYHPRSLDTAMSRIRKKANPHIERAGLVYVGEYEDKSLTSAVRDNKLGGRKFLRHWVSIPGEMKRYYIDVKWRVLDQDLLDQGYVLLSDIVTDSERKRLAYEKYNGYVKRSRHRAYIRPFDLELIRNGLPIEFRAKPPTPEHVRLVTLVPKGNDSAYMKLYSAAKSGRFPAHQSEEGWWFIVPADVPPDLLGEVQST